VDDENELEEMHKPLVVGLSAVVAAMDELKTVVAP